jgi:hypothetical protein
VQGQQPATVRIGYVYDGVYQETPRFGSDGTGALRTGPSTRKEETLWQEYKKMIGGWNARTAGLGGWDLDIHHSYDPVGKVLYLGDGRQRSSQNAKQIITTVVGTGSPGYGGDGGPAAKAQLNKPSHILIAPDGTLYVTDTGNFRIRKVNRDGIITTVAGNGTQGTGGDGGPATEAQLNQPSCCGMYEGSLYITEPPSGQVARFRRVGPDGIITTVKSDGDSTGGYWDIFVVDPQSHRL